MASLSAICLGFRSFLSQSDKTSQSTGLKLASVGWARSTTGFPSLTASRFRVSCAAKPETVEKVCDIVRNQLALNSETLLTPETTFVDLGADSLDTVEMVMGLEEEFKISVEEENSQSIKTIQEVADLIEKLLVDKEAAGGGSLPQKS